MVRGGIIRVGLGRKGGWRWARARQGRGVGVEEEGARSAGCERAGERVKCGGRGDKGGEEDLIWAGEGGGRAPACVVSGELGAAAAGEEVGRTGVLFPRRD